VTCQYILRSEKVDVVRSVNCGQRNRFAAVFLLDLRHMTRSSARVLSFKKNMALRKTSLVRKNANPQKANLHKNASLT